MVNLSFREGLLTHTTSLLLFLSLSFSPTPHHVPHKFITTPLIYLFFNKYHFTSTGYCSTASDVFSAGVILYILLCGYPPFNSKSVRQLFVRTVKGAYKLTGPEWDNISLEAKDLIKKMLDVNPETRIGTSEVLRHPWIQRVRRFCVWYMICM